MDFPAALARIDLKIPGSFDVMVSYTDARGDQQPETKSRTLYLRSADYYWARTTSFEVAAPTEDVDRLDTWPSKSARTRTMG